MTDVEDQLRNSLHDYAASVDPSPLPEPGVISLRRAPHRSVARRQLMAAAAVVVILGAALAAWSPWRQAAPAHPPVSGQWIPVPAAPLSPRTHASMLWTGTEFIVWGGDAKVPSPTAPLVDGAALNPTTSKWRPISPHPFSSLHTRAVWTGSRMVVLDRVGGAAYDPATDRWTDLPSTGPVNLAEVQFDDLVALDGTIVAYGFQQGQSVAKVTGASPTTTAVQVWTLTPGSTEWVTAGPTKLADDGVYTLGRRRPLIVTDDGFVAWGTVDGWRYRLAGGWSRLPAIPTTSDAQTGAEAQAAWVDGRLVAIANDVVSADLSVTTLEGSTWTALRPLAGQSWIVGQLAVAGSQIVASRYGANPIPDPVLIDPRTATTRSMSGFPLQTYGGQSIGWSGSQVFIWGGPKLSSQTSAPSFDDDLTNTGALWTP